MSTSIGKNEKFLEDKDEKNEEVLDNRVDGSRRAVFGISWADDSTVDPTHKGSQALKSGNQSQGGL